MIVGKVVTNTDYTGKGVRIDYVEYSVMGLIKIPRTIFYKFHSEHKYVDIDGAEVKLSPANENLIDKALCSELMRVYGKKHKVICEYIEVMLKNIEHLILINVFTSSKKSIDTIIRLYINLQDSVDVHDDKLCSFGRILSMRYTSGGFIYPKVFNC